ncbi:MAG: hypothetical protein JO047_17490 [Alphaproteobacteria bacterium]|nr:hypothetical protein [Alphaproteobacteria bacterium]
MAGARIATTRSQDLQPLVAGGQSAEDAWSALHALLSRELSARHAALLAEPVANPARGETDWYGERGGPAAKLSALPPDQRAALRARLETSIGEIEALAARLRSGRTESERHLGDLLGLALQIPDEDAIFVQAGEPVLVAWGHARASATTGVVTLAGRRPVAPGPMRILPAPPPALLVHPAAATHWPLALSAAGLLLLGLALLLLRDPLGWSQVAAGPCRIAPQDTRLLADLREAAARGTVLRGLLAAVTEDAGRRRQQCPPAAAMLPPGAGAPAAPDVSRAIGLGAHGGRLQIVLGWDDRNDLDLHVICPSGEQISYRSRSGCGGTLDVDANATPTGSTTTPVENVDFDNPAPGIYRILVDPFAMRDGNASPFRVTIRRAGQPDQVVTGTAVKDQHMQRVTEVSVTSP